MVFFGMLCRLDGTFPLYTALIRLPPVLEGAANFAVSTLGGPELNLG